MTAKQILLSLIIVCCCLTFATAQQSHYKVYAIGFARSGYPFMEADWAAGASKAKHLDITFSIWLIKGDKGRNILVDAGFYNDTKEAKEFQLTEYTRPDSALRKLNVKPEDITDIIISHPHWDHIDGIDLFPKAHFWMQKEDYNYFVGQAWQTPKDTGGFIERNVRKLLELNLNGRLTLINGDNKEIMPGIRVFTGSKHTYASQYTLVNTGTNRIILASDNVWIYANIVQMLPPVSGGTLSPTGYINAMKRMKSMVSDIRYIIPGHDGKVFQKFIEASHNIVEIK
ncbi:N-acyl homoserine lactonase family protein [Mucilaginibacter sp. Bleaf8]|uniref:N-acyl homoserine lactonase family protein n=1 Tax=Mucilaginibacter sp. Bleaf8 TaxID=2834430 RepID=UPI001BCE914A|nr:N-acyl homoserine lactonase family protein [Mucilaginibacter sp. Bleaf8]MBS7564380.1 N-acyl homoserine lactonase family protein [Mucilaginibacter sp. Bleaf8]